MLIRSAAIVLLVCGLTGCKAVDGLYEPGCMAYAGSRILLSDGTFSWEKFTDQLSVDADGNKIDPFPGYPRHGTYEIDGQRLMLSFDDSDVVETMHVLQREGRVLLLTATQYSTWESSGDVDGCALTRIADKSME